MSLHRSRSSSLRQPLRGRFELLEQRHLLAATPIAIHAAGKAGTESMSLLIDGVTVRSWTNVGGNATTGVFNTFNYTHPTDVTANRVRVALTNDNGNSRDLRVDGVTVNGVKFESESSETYTTGTGEALTGITPGYKRSEWLTNNGYFQYYGLTPVGGTAIEILAAGATTQETVQLQIDGAAVRTWTRVKGNYTTGVYETFRYTTAGVVAPNQIRVVYTNDGPSTTGADKNLRVDALRVNNVRYETEALDTYSTGGPLASRNGFRRSEFLYNNGYFAYKQPFNPGTLAIASSQYTVVEGTASVGVTFVRTGGADGTVTLDYTTVNATALAGQDYAAQSGVVTFLQGETTKTVNIAISNDALAEGTEVFNVAADRVTGGAGLGAPRTTTVRIIDDEAPSPSGGNGLLGEYFSDVTLTTRAAQRTDGKIDFNWVTSSPAPGVGVDNFSIRWSGQIESLYTGNYTFYLTSDDGSRLWVNNQQIIDGWVDQAATTRTGTFSFVAGQKYDLRVEYYERGGNASVGLEWQSTRQTRQVVPQSQLFSMPIEATSGSFTPETIISGLTQPTAIDFGPNGAMFIATKSGVVKSYIGGELQDFIDLSAEVNDTRDRGLLSLAVHPNFAANPYVYLLYTYDPPEAATGTGLAARDQFGNRPSRVLRVTANVATNYRTAVPGSGVVIVGANSTWANISHPELDGTDNFTIAPSGVGVSDIMVVDSQSHTVGALRFLPDGSLLISNGDGTSYGRVDPRTALVQSLDEFRGKVLRVNPLTGQGYSDNPFFNGDLNSDPSKIYNYGLRNPFRMAIHPTLGVPYIGDVGWNTYEEINFGRGKNFGWPWYEGAVGTNQPTGGYRDLPEAAAFYANNNATPPAYARSHAAGGVAIVVGDFYTAQQYPAQYRNSLFFTDYGDPTIRALQFDALGNVSQELVVHNNVGTVVMMDMGPDGLMYYVNINGSIGRLNFAASTSTATVAAGIPVSAPVLALAPQVTSAPSISASARRAAFAQLGSEARGAALLLATAQERVTHASERVKERQQPTEESAQQNFEKFWDRLGRNFKRARLSPRG